MPQTTTKKTRARTNTVDRAFRGSSLGAKYDQVVNFAKSKGRLPRPYKTSGLHSELDPFTDSERILGNFFTNRQQWLRRGLITDAVDITRINSILAQYGKKLA